MRIFTQKGLDEKWVHPQRLNLKVNFLPAEITMNITNSLQENDDVINTENLQT